MVDAKGFKNQARNSKSGLSGKAIGILIAILAVFLAWTGVGIMFDYIEISEIGEAYTEIFVKNLITQGMVFAICSVAVFVTLFISIIFLRRNLRVLNIERAIFEKLGTSLVLCVIAAVIISGAVGGSLWEKLLMFSNPQQFGKTDPVFGKDIGYYVFQRPFLESVCSTIFGVWIFISAFIAAIYGFLGTAFGGYSAWKFFRLKSVAIHNIINVAILLIINCFNYILKAESILYGSFGELQGAGYTAKTVWLTFYRVAPLLLIVLCTLLLILIAKSKRKAAIKTACVFPAVLIFTAVAAACVQGIMVSPNEVIKEQENIASNIKFTQDAYGLSDITEVVFDVKNDLSTEDLTNYNESVENIRILDLDANLVVLNQIQGIRNYYKFTETDIVPYNINGKKTAVAITPREITKENLSDNTDTYINRTLRYTHGFGLTMNAINKVTPQGQPEFYIKDVPPKYAEGIDKIKQPRIYYGEITDDYVVVGNEKYKELDYSEDQEDIEFSYDGNGGVKLNPWNRLLFAAKYGDIRLLISDLVSSDSRILINRNIKERLEMVAPFLAYDNDPYMVVDEDGKLKWIVDAYTTTDRYPYSQSVGEFNYIRNSVKATIDAYDGEVKFYIVDKNDPIAQSYSKIYPNLFERGELSEKLKSHIKYPEFLFDLQSRVYGNYHISNPTVFYNKNDTWAIAKERYGTSSEEKEIVPYYNMMRLDGKNEEELLLTIPYTLANKDNMVAWLAVRSEWDDYGKLNVYKFPKGVNIYGPMQIENRINSHIDISKELNLWSQGGSQVIRGNMIVVPIGNSVLYVEPIYIASSNKTTLPELKQVVVAYDEKIVMRSNLQDAIYALFDKTAPTPVENSVVKEEVDTQTTDNESKIPEGEVLTFEAVAEAVISEFEKIKEASASGNWNEFGESMTALEKSVEELKKQIEK